MTVIIRVILCSTLGTSKLSSGMYNERMLTCRVPSCLRRGRGSLARESAAGTSPLPPQTPLPPGKTAPIISPSSLYTACNEGYPKPTLNPTCKPAQARCRWPVCHTWHRQGPTQRSTPCLQQLGAYLEVEGYPLDGAAGWVLLGERIIQGGQAAPLLLRPAPLRVWLQLQRCS